MKRKNFREDCFTTKINQVAIFDDMAEKKRHIQYWLDSAEESWQSAAVLIEGGRYAIALFCWHLAIEKILKAHWVKNNKDNYPPRTHNLVLLHDQTQFWNLEGRNPRLPQRGLQSSH